MPKRSGDFILRDRLQITLDGDGAAPTVYGRMDLSDFVNAIEKKGIAVQEIYLQVRDPNNASQIADNTGIWNPVAGAFDDASPATQNILYKIVATTRAYESLLDVGIASPDVIYMQEHLVTFNNTTGGGVASGIITPQFREWPTRDLHPEGYTLVSDLLIGVAVDNSGGFERDYWDDAVLEIDIMMICKAVTVTQKMLTNLLTQAQDV